MRQSTTAGLAHIGALFWSLLLLLFAQTIQASARRSGLPERSDQPWRVVLSLFFFMSVELWCGASGIIGQLVGKLIGLWYL